MGQDESVQRRAASSLRPQVQPARRPALEHQCLLKLRKTPFRNSTRIVDNPPLFLQKIDTSLTKLLAERFGGTKLFVEEDIIKLVETCLYTLAFLQSHNLVYTDLCTDNIFYDTEQGIFKLLPLELIPESSYELVLQGKKFRTLSPEMIMALRMQEQQLPDQIVHRSNIFVLGMILLEVCTLKPSSECYDDDNFDLLDMTIQSRLSMVRQFYPAKIAELLSVMLEYECSERPDPEQLSIRVDQELTAQASRTQQMEYQKRKSVVCQKKEFPEKPYTHKVPQTPTSKINQPFTPRQHLEQAQPLLRYQVLSQKNPTPLADKANSNPYQYHMARSPMRNNLRVPEKSPNFHLESSDCRRSFKPAPQPGFSGCNKAKESSPQRHREARQKSKYPSIIYQTDFYSKQNKGESTYDQILKIKTEIQKSRKRIQQFSNLDPSTSHSHY